MNCVAGDFVLIDAPAFTTPWGFPGGEHSENSIAISRTTVRDSGVFQHYWGPIKGSLKPLGHHVN